MNEIEQYVIRPWKADSFSFAGAAAFTRRESGRTFLLSPAGTSLLMTGELLPQILGRAPGAELVQKLKARGFGTDFCRPDIRQSGKFEPEFLMIDLTTGCNMNCFYCLRHFENSGKTIDREILTEILDYMIAYYRQTRRPLTVQPWGGEPLLAADSVFYIDDYLRKAGVRFRLLIQTNGILLTDGLCRELHDRNIALGISIDGCRAVHDLHRRDLGGQATFDRVCGGIANARKYYGRDLGTISVISRDSLPMLENSMDVLVREIGISTLKFNFLHPNTELFDMTRVVEDGSMTDFWTRVIRKLLSLNREGYPCVESNLYDKLMNLLTGTCGDICHSNGCTGGYNLVSFSQEGDIFPCEMIGNREYRIGSVRDGIGLPELIRQNVSRSSYFCEKCVSACTSCPWRVFCRGGCTAAAGFYGRKAGETDPKECASNRALYPLLIGTVLSDSSAAEILTGHKISCAAREE